MRELDIDAERATRLIIQLKDKPEILAIETVEPRDRPVPELKDGEDYKDSASLSTGQVHGAKARTGSGGPDRCLCAHVSA